MKRDEFKALRRVYFGMVYSTMDSYGTATKRLCWDSAHQMASFVEQQEDAENEAEQKVADAAIDGDA